MTPEQIDALAAACERAAGMLAELCPSCDGLTEDVRQYYCDECSRDTTMSTALRAHARALRDGRVTVSEEANNETHT